MSPVGVEVMTVGLETLVLPLEDKGGSLLAVAGEIDLANAAQFRDALLTALVRGSGYLHLDLSGVDFMDSAGVHVLVATRRRARLMGGHVGVVAHSRPVQRVWQVSGLAPDVLHCDCAGSDAGEPS
jgi:anti-sigma B factor antagonist